MAADAVFEAKVTENIQVHYDEAHRWYYLADQEASELLVFRQAESHPAGRVGEFCDGTLLLSFCVGSKYKGLTIFTMSC